jgi:hypothetical protein
MSLLTMLDASLNVTSSLASAAGLTRCASRVGPTTALCGRGVHPVSLSAPLDDNLAVTIRDISPPILSVWSGPLVPQCCLANKSQARKFSEKLQDRLNAAAERMLQQPQSGVGSMIYKTVLKPHNTALGRSISRLRSSAHPTSDNALSLVRSGWPTASTRDHKGGYEGGRMRNGQISTDTLDVTAQLAGWSTAQARDWKGPQGRAYKDGVLDMPAAAILAGWVTPIVQDSKQSGLAPSGSGQSMKLSFEVQATNWATENGPARLTARGEMLTGCSAEMGSGGQLNPRFSAWLMGYPQSWCAAALSCQLPTLSRQKPKRVIDVSCV